MSQGLLLILIGVVVAAAVAVPLVRRGRPGSDADDVQGDPGRPAGDRPETPDELAELELDFAMGRLGEADYARLRQRAEAAAAAPTDSVPSPVVETPPAGPPVVLVPATADRAEAMIARYQAKPRPSCPACGERPEPGARYCSSCGRALAACPSCGQPAVQPESRFCSSCGAALPA